MATMAGTRPSATRERAPRENEAKPTATRRNQAAAAVLGARGLHLPTGQEVVEFDLRRAALADILGLARAYGLRQLWIHDEARALLGLPAELQRNGRSLDLEDRAAVVRHRAIDKAAAAGWRIAAGESADGSPVAGLRPWWTCYEPGTSDRSTWLECYVPAWCAPYWCEAEQDIEYLARGCRPEQLLSGLELFAAHVGQRFRRGPGSMGAQLISTMRREELPERAIPPREIERHPNPDGDRLSVGVTIPPEGGAETWCHCFDINGAYLSAAGSAHLGMGAMRHVEGADLAGARRGRAGRGQAQLGEAWQGGARPDLARGGEARGAELSSAPSLASMAGRYRATVNLPPGVRSLPSPCPFAVDGKAHWYSHASLALAEEIGCGIEIHEAWLWEQSARSLYTFYGHLRDARTALQEGGEPGARLALLLVKRSYAAGIGRLSYLAPGREPTYRRHRPEWRHDITAKAGANLYRHVWRIYQATGRAPIASQADAVVYACVEDDPAEAAKALGLTVSGQLGKFKGGGSLPLDQVRDLVAKRGGRARSELFAQLRETVR